MAKTFATLREKMPQSAQQQVEQQANAMIQELLLHELRQARGLSQQEMAKRLNLKQPAISRLEKRTDMYLSSLRSHIEAMGGELEVIARFNDGCVKIRQISEL